MVDFLDWFFSFFSGWKTYLAAAGLFGLALYQLSKEDYQNAIQSFLAGLAAVGLRSAIAKSDHSPPPAR